MDKETLLIRRQQIYSTIQELEEELKTLNEEYPQTSDKTIINRISYLEFQIEDISKDVDVIDSILKGEEN